MERQPPTAVGPASSFPSSLFKPRSSAAHLRVMNPENDISNDSKKDQQRELNFIESLSLVTGKSQAKSEKFQKSAAESYRLTNPSRYMTVQNENLSVLLSQDAAGRCIEHRKKISSEDHIKSKHKDLGHLDRRICCGKQEWNLRPCATKTLSRSVTNIFPTTQQERASCDTRVDGPQHLLVTQLGKMVYEGSCNKTGWSEILFNPLDVDASFTPGAGSSAAILTTAPTKPATNCGETSELPSLYSEKNVDTPAAKVKIHGHSGTQLPHVSCGSLPNSPLTVTGVSSSTTLVAARQCSSPVQLCDLKVVYACSRASSQLAASPRSQDDLRLCAAEFPTDVGRPMFRSTATLALHGSPQLDCVTKASDQGEPYKPADHVSAIKSGFSNGNESCIAARNIKSNDEISKLHLGTLMNRAKLLSTQAEDLALSSSLITNDAYDAAGSIIGKLKCTAQQGSDAPVSTRTKQRELQKASCLMAELRFLKKLESAYMEALDDVCDKSAQLVTEATALLNSPSGNAALKEMIASLKPEKMETTEDRKAYDEQPINTERRQSRLAVTRTDDIVDTNVDAIENMSTARFSQNGLRLFTFPRPRRPGRIRIKSSAASKANLINTQPVLSDVERSRQQHDSFIDAPPLFMTIGEIRSTAGERSCNPHHPKEHFRDDGICSTQHAVCGRLQPDAKYYTSQPITPV